MTAILGELMGNSSGLMRGKGGSMHLTSVKHNMLGSYAIIGAHLTIANGAAWSAQYRGTDQVAVCFFGDGTTNIGAFHEALNFAVIWKLPVVFVCENNLYMEYTSIHDVTAVEHPAADRASAYGLEPVLIDGNDVDVVYRTAQRALDLARKGGGPSLIEAETYRHGGHSRADPGKYRPDEEVQAWLAKDPIPRYRARLLAAGHRRERHASRSTTKRRPQIDAGHGDRAQRAAAAARARETRTCGRTEARHGATNLSRGRRGRHGAGDAPRPERRVPRRGRGRRRRRVQDHRRAARRVRPEARQGHADLRAGDPRRRDGRRDDGPAPDRRDHVLRLLRRLLGHRRESRSRRRAT